MWCSLILYVMYLCVPVGFYTNKTVRSFVIFYRISSSSVIMGEGRASLFYNNLFSVFRIKQAPNGSCHVTSSVCNGRCSNDGSYRSGERHCY